MQLLVGKMHQVMLCDVYYATDLEVELLAFVSQAARFGAGDAATLLRHASDLQQRVASVSFRNDLRYNSVLLHIRGGESRSCFGPAQPELHNYVLQLQTALREFDETLQV